jgi:hypothetical protein
MAASYSGPWSFQIHGPIYYERGHVCINSKTQRHTSMQPSWTLYNWLVSLQCPWPEGQVALTFCNPNAAATFVPRLGYDWCHCFGLFNRIHLFHSRGPEKSIFGAMVICKLSMNPPMSRIKISKRKYCGGTYSRVLVPIEIGRSISVVAPLVPLDDLDQHQCEGKHDNNASNIILDHQRKER